MPLPRLGNTPRLDDLLRDGKIYLSLSDAVTLALENNYDIAIARINLDIADTDILRTQGGLDVARRVDRLVTNTLGGRRRRLRAAADRAGRRVRRAAAVRALPDWC